MFGTSTQRGALKYHIILPCCKACSNCIKALTFFIKTLNVRTLLKIQTLAVARINIYLFTYLFDCFKDKSAHA
jgi:hypothetical protein